MRVLFPVCTSGALLLMATSINMNWTYWHGQGADPTQALTFASVSVGVDIFKCCLPLIADRARVERNWLGCGLAIALFVGCMSFSLISAIGYASLSRGLAVGNQEALGLRYRATRDEVARLNTKLVDFGDVRPQPVIEEALATARQDRRWLSSAGCTAATADASLAYCREIGALKVDLAKAEEASRMRARIATLEGELGGLLRTGGHLQADTLASFISKLTGFAPERVQFSITLFFAVLVELVAAFGFYLAKIARRLDEAKQWRSPAQRVIDADFVAADTRKSLSQPVRRVVRAPDGQLMIE